MIELLGNEGRRLRIRVEMRRLAGNFQVPATRKIAVNIFAANYLFNQVDRSQRVSIHAPRQFKAVTPDQGR